MSKSKNFDEEFSDPISLEGNLRMNHVLFLFHYLLQQHDKSKDDLGRKYGRVSWYTGTKGIRNTEFINEIADFIASEEEKPEGLDKNSTVDLSIGKNRTLILLNVPDLIAVFDTEGREIKQPDFTNPNSTHFTVLNLQKDAEDNLTFRYSDSLGKTVNKDFVPSAITDILKKFGIKEGQHKDFISAKQGAVANCGYCAVFNALKMLGIDPPQKKIDDFITVQRKFLEAEFGKTRNEFEFEESDFIASIRNTSTPNSSPIKPSKQNLLNISLPSISSDESSGSESDSEPEEQDQSNSLIDSLNTSFSKLNIKDVKVSKEIEKLLAIYGDDSSDEEDTKQKLQKYKTAEEAWEVFLSPRVYYNGRKYPLVKQDNGKYSVNIPNMGNWVELVPSVHNHLIGNNNAMVAYIYFGPEEYNKPIHQHVIDSRKQPFVEANYNKLKASFELHYKGIQALYEDRISEPYYARKAKELSTQNQLDTIKSEVGTAINKALNTLCLSVNWDGGSKTGLQNLHDMLEKKSIKRNFDELMQEILRKRAISTRQNSQMEKLRPFSEAIYNELFGSNDVFSILGSVVDVAIKELENLEATKTAGRKGNYYYAAPNKTIRGRSYEELANAKNLPKTKLGKFAWSIVKEMATDNEIYSALEAKKEHLLNDLISDLSKLNQTEIDQKFSSLGNISSIPKKQILQILDNLILHNLSNIPLGRKTFSDNKELIQESFSDIMINIRLSNRSQTRRIKNLQKEEGDKVWSKTVAWAHAFEQNAQTHALEKETITPKAGRNSLILDFGKYEEGKRKGNTVTEGIEKLKQDLKIDDKTIAYCVIQILRGNQEGNLRNLKGDPIYTSETHSSILTNIAGLFILEFKRNPNFTSFMVLDLVRSGKITLQEALDQQGVDGGMLPMSMKDAMKAARCLHDLYSPYMPHPYQIQGEEKFELTDGKVLDLITREQKIYDEWNKLYQEIEENKSSYNEGRDFVSAKKMQLEDLDSSDEESQIVESELEYYSTQKSNAKQALKSLGTKTIQDDFSSTKPKSTVNLPKTKISSQNFQGLE